MDAFNAAAVARDRGGPAQPLLSVRGIVKHFGGRRSLSGRGIRGAVHAVDDVSFDVAKGETLGIVGESGCGKSTLARLIMHIIPADAGEILFDGEAVGTNPLDFAAYRREVQMVFRDSYASLNPRLTVEDTRGVRAARSWACSTRSDCARPRPHVAGRTRSGALSPATCRAKSRRHGSPAASGCYSTALNGS
jgi:ABC-type glutathione transport system ATPase component